ncbi:hypothetical protein HanPSC8_Chr10g0418741 [Helianthus annuus]|nr:hypothetical protein HanPSC8_Chr10g0418741 [Helianthus annuus]
MKSSHTQSPILNNHDKKENQFLKRATRDRSGSSIWRRCRGCRLSRHGCNRRECYDSYNRGFLHNVANLGHFVRNKVYMD